MTLAWTRESWRSAGENPWPGTASAPLCSPGGKLMQAAIVAYLVRIVDESSHEDNLEIGAQVLNDALAPARRWPQPILFS